MRSLCRSILIVDYIEIPVSSDLDMDMGTDKKNILCGTGYRYVNVVKIFVFGRFAGTTVLFGIDMFINIVNFY